MSGSAIPNDTSKLRMPAGVTALLSVTTPAALAADVAPPAPEPRAITGAVQSVLAAQQGATQAPPPVDLEEVVVSSKVFTQNDAFGATKMGLDLKDTPQTVTVVTGDLIETSGMRTFNDFYKVDASGGTAHSIDEFPRNYYRGFAQQGPNATRVDGFRMPGNTDLDFATIDRFEVIKGPTSTLYGQSPIGGTLNAISKLPQREFAGEIELTGGQYDYYRVDADLTGAMSGDGAWSYRLIGAYQDSDSFLDYVYEDMTLLSASVLYEPSDATRYILRATLQDKSLNAHFPPILQLAGDGEGDVLTRVLEEGLQIPDVPRSRYFGMPWNHTDIEAKFVQFQGEHDFGDNWQARAHAQFNRVRYTMSGFQEGGPFDEDGFAYVSYAYGFDQVQDMYGAEVNLFGDVHLFGRDHTLFFGVDYSRIKLDDLLGFEAMSIGYEDSLFNIFDPTYSLQSPISRIDEFAYVYDSDNVSELYGATVQLILNPSERVKVLLGGRYSFDTILQRYRESPDDHYEVFEDVDFDNFTMQAGVTFELTDAMNLYASYGETFEPYTYRVYDGPDSPGVLIDPEEGTNLEVGLKADLTQDLSMSMAIFDMERTNIAQTDPDNPAFYRPLGTQRGRGVELGAQGRLTPALNVYASVAWLDAEFSEGLYKGLQPANAPEFGVSVFANYEILDGPAKGLGFGLGVVHKSGRETFDDVWTEIAGEPVTFDFGDFTEVDASIFYERGRWAFTLSGTNVFDEKYYSPAFTRLDMAANVNPPRTVTATMKYRL